MNNLPTKSQQPQAIQLLQRSRDQIAKALPKHISPDRMLRVGMTEFRKTPALAKCSPESFLGAMIQSSQLGLEPGSALGHCYLIPYKGQVQLQLGYKGMLDLCRRSGEVDAVVARAVFQGDEFKYEFGLDENLKHTPRGEEDPSKITHVYAVAHLKGGAKQFEVMSRDQVERIRQTSQGANRGPWVDHWEEMARKTVIRRLFKYLPVSVEITKAIGLDEAFDAGKSQDNAALVEREDGSFTEESSADRLKKKLHQTEEKEIQSEDVQVDPQGEFANYTEPKE